MNDLITKQNKKKFLTLQYGARESHNCARKIDRLTFIFCLLNAIIVYINAEHVLVFSTILTVVVIYQESLYMKKINQASDMKMYADSYLYGFDLSNLSETEKENVLNTAIKIRQNKPIKSKLAFENNGKSSHRGVKDWYVGIDSEVDKESAIFYCQKQNLDWDYELAKKTAIMFTVFFFLFSIFILLRNYENYVSDTINVFLYLSPVYVSFLFKFKRMLIVFKYQLISKTLVDNSPEVITEKHLRKIQESIDKRRRSGFCNSDLLHKFSSFKKHEAIELINKEGFE